MQRSKQSKLIYNKCLTTIRRRSRFLLNSKKQRGHRLVVATVRVSAEREGS